MVWIKLSTTVSPQATQEMEMWMISNSILFSLLLGLSFFLSSQSINKPLPGLYSGYFLSHILKYFAFHLLLLPYECGGTKWYIQEIPLWYFQSFKSLDDINSLISFYHSKSFQNLSVSSLYSVRRMKIKRQCLLLEN